MMEMTFLTMHDLSPSATILFASESIDDVLGYLPEEVIGKSCFDYFHPEELPFARSKYGESIQFDNAAVLAYCRLKNKKNDWIKCECVFTVVYDVFIAATTLFKKDPKSDGRAQAAPTIQKHFERPGPLDPRYRMIDHLAPKFRSTSIARSSVHEPRAAFLLNRFSETLPIMYATHAAQFVLSINPDEAVGRSFYEFIDEGYLQGAVNAIERAKGNDSIAYLRLLWKEKLDDVDEDMEDEDDEDDEEDEEEEPRVDGALVQEDMLVDGHTARRLDHQRIPNRFEVECLLSSSSDGLIVVVRQAPPIEGLGPDERPPGVFASPWARAPLAPYMQTPPPPSPVEASFRDELPETIPAVPGPSDQHVMNSIRDVSVFVWSIAMLNDEVSQDNANNMVDGEGSGSRLRNEHLRDGV